MMNMVTHSELPTIGSILDRLGRLLAAEELEVVIDRMYPLEEGREAQQAVMNDSVLGKIVVTP